MRLVFITQVLDRQDAILGFVPRWVEAFAAHVEAVRVIALSIGDVSGLPHNVDVRVVGRKGTFWRYMRYRSFLREALARQGFDTVFAHMIPRYSTVAARPARRAGARHFLWYTHGAVDDRLRRAERVVDAIFTASEESMRLETPKKVVTGHGIDLEHFDSRGVRPLGRPRILSVGRMTPSKDPLTLIDALALLRAEGRDVDLDVVGGGLAAGDDEYRQSVVRHIDERNLTSAVQLHDAVPYLRIPNHYRAASVVVNSSFTGSVDKVVLEAMACERAVVSCNDSFPRVIRSLGERARVLTFEPRDAKGLAMRLRQLLDLAIEEREALGRELRGIVAREHEVDALIQRLVEHMGRPR